MSKKYTEDSVEVFRGLEGCRMKPSMYLGAKGWPMFLKCMGELADNAADEFLAGRNTYLHLDLDTSDGSIIVADKGAGIPVGIHKTTKLSTLTTVYLELHAGAKFDGKTYGSSGGTHGVGAAAVNAVSEFFRPWTFREGKWWGVKFGKGKVLDKAQPTKIDSKVLKRLGYKPKQGTIVYFKPELAVISDGKAIKFQKKVVAQWLRNKSLLNPGLEIVLGIDGKKVVYKNKDLKPLIEKSLEEFEAQPMGKALLHFDQKVTLALQWSDYSGDEGLMTYVSSINTTDHGKHEEGFRKALVKVLSTHKAKKEKFSPKDLYCGLIGHFDLKMSRAEFSSQTKEKLTSDVTQMVEEHVTPILTEFFTKNKSLARKIIKRATMVKKAKEEMSKAIDNIQKAKKNSKGITSPGMHTKCPKCNPQQRELYIVEGDSAAGPAKEARDKTYQEVVKLKGKIMNAARATPDKVLSSEAVQIVLAAIGYNYDSHQKNVAADANLRVGKIFTLMDADVDGGHITVLTLTLLYKMLPKVFDEGRVYVVDAPLFSAFYKGKRYYGKTFKSVEQQLPKGAKDCIVRSKGWGEISVETLREIAFDPSTRQVMKVVPIKGKSAVKFERLVGSDSAARKELLGLD